VLRFLLTRRWLGLIAAVLVVGAVCVLLGRWQFGRYDDRQQRNDTTRANLAATPVPVDQVLDVEEPPAESEEWRPVQATGSYDTANQVTVRYRTRDGAAGVDVVVPLLGASGTALLVDRGWVATENSGSARPDVPPPPSGTVTVTGWVRLDATGEGIQPDAGSVRAISSEAIGETLPYDVYRGYVALGEESPSVEPSPLPAEEPDLSGGPSFFYGLQWWFFAVLALAFVVYFARHEYRLGKHGGHDVVDRRVRVPGRARRPPAT
jgi:cytochrome oxidase assembly protein ShyY1